MAQGELTRLATAASHLHWGNSTPPDISSDRKQEGHCWKVEKSIKPQESNWKNARHINFVGEVLQGAGL